MFSTFKSLVKYIFKAEAGIQDILPNGKGLFFTTQKVKSHLSLTLSVTTLRSGPGSIRRLNPIIRRC